MEESETSIESKTNAEPVKETETATNTAEKTVAKSSSSSKESIKDTKISASKSVSNTPDYKQPTQTTTQEQPQIYRIDPNSGRAERVSHEDAQSQLHLSNQQFNRELLKGEVLILRNDRLSISTQETISQINDPSRATPLMAFAIRRLQQDATTLHGDFPSDYYVTFSRAFIRESIRLNGADAGIEAVGKAFGSEDFSQGRAALHLYEALARRDENTGFDKVQHFIASAVSEFENTKIGTDIRQYGKEIFFDEIPSWFTDDVGYDPNDMLANNRGQAFGDELYRRYHPVRANPIDAAKRQINEFKRDLTRESSPMNTESKTNTEEKPVANTEKNKATYKSTETYNRDKAVKYAHQYVNPIYGWDEKRYDNPAAYNHSYYPFEADCTNYISQCLYAGGWKQIVGGIYSSDAWYYKKYVPGEHFWDKTIKDYSHTWTVANDFYKFCSKHPDRAKKVSIEKDDKGLLKVKGTLEVGDIVQMDGLGKKKPDGEWDHSMIITDISSNGELYVSAHTSDLENEPLSEIQGRNKNAKYAGWHII